MALDIERLEQSFAAVAPQANRLADVFYGRLFNDFPEVKPLFENTDLDEQKKKLIASLKLVVENLRRPEDLVPALEKLGSRHVAYGAEPDHYPAVGATLLKSLAEVADDQWNSDFETAWSKAYGEIANIMLQGAAACTA